MAEVVEEEDGGLVELAVPKDGARLDSATEEE